MMVTLRTLEIWTAYLVEVQSVTLEFQVSHKQAATAFNDSTGNALKTQAAAV